jgi:SAM-dependent methyltransferase
VTRRLGLAVLGLGSGSVVASEVLLTRLLSVCTWYGLAFLVLSIAMLGTTSGALAAARARAEGKPLTPWVANRLVMLSLGLVAAAMITASVPLVFSPDVTSLASVLVVVAAATVPMAAGGGVVARLMAELPVPIARAYAVDLISAALGALAPLVLLGPLSGPSTIVLVGAIAAFAALIVAPIGHRRLACIALAVCVALILTTELSPYGLVLRYSKGKTRPEVRPLFEAWNPLSYVALDSFQALPFLLWSPGSTFKPKIQPISSAFIDGEAGTALYAYGRLDQIDSLKLDGTAIAHALRPGGTACVMGTGGGRDLETALLFGHDRVIGFEINPSMVAMLRRVHAYSPILDDPRVHVVVGDARAELARTDVRCRVLQASLVDTWAATSAGAFSHTESTLYTLEAWSLFLRRVEPDGVLTFSRWCEPTRPGETARLVALAVGALLQRGVARPRDHLALISGGLVATIVASPSDLTPVDVANLRDAVHERGLTTLIGPGEHSSDPILDRLLDARDIAGLGAVGEPLQLDTSPPTDERPFFFQLLAPRAWMHPLDVLRSYQANQKGILAGNVAAAIELLLAATASALVALVLLGPTLLRAARERDPPLPGRSAAVYFASLGAGFMLTEVALVQRMHVVLGHPTYALVVVLAGLLVATGVGSALSSRVLRSRSAVTTAALVAASMLATIPWALIRPLAHATLEAPFGARVAWCGACAAGLGVVLGMLFPGALAYTHRERATPVALALGGATSVVGGALAVVISVTLGIPSTFAAAAALYLVAAMSGPARWRSVES